MIDFRIDDVVPCLREVATGKLYDTEVIRIRRKSILRQYHTGTGWSVNWERLSRDTEVYALVLAGTNDVQGLVAVRYDDDLQAVYVAWASVAPHNNKWRYGQKRFSGVGGHLLAIASELSVRHGYDGFIVAEASDEKLLQYYASEFGATLLPPINNPYRFMIDGVATARLREVYSYVWTDDVI